MYCRARTAPLGVLKEFIVSIRADFDNVPWNAFNLKVMHILVISYCTLGQLYTMCSKTIIVLLDELNI